ncbi:hypothetical protein DT376_00375 [Pseudomonas aeruginosa]|uniref:Uncharacterized protein n=1 Tax=Pseudomonas aeruginosa TaxID=287 RepID=A0A367MH09_PSEAI|nr:hypothetical protein DT376_00375 [Pseudomonas aeruginosa]
MISLERKGHAPTLLYERGIAERFREAIIRRYFSRGYLLDPFCLAVEEGLPEGFYTLGEIAPDDFFQSAYYQTYYLGAGAVEDVYYILDLGPTEKLSICLYNGLSASRYSDAQVAALAGLALSHTIAKAVLYGFVTRGIPFFRTPKMRSSHGLLVALAEAREEVFVMLRRGGAAAGIVAVQGVPSRDLLIWVAMLLVQSLPYLAALVMALLSSLPKPREELAGGAERIGG